MAWLISLAILVALWCMWRAQRGAGLICILGGAVIVYAGKSAHDFLRETLHHHNAASADLAIVTVTSVLIVSWLLYITQYFRKKISG